MPLTLQQKLVVHQIHPAKLAVDISGSIASTYLFWQHEWLFGILVTFPASIAISFFLVRFADLEKLSQSAFGKYVSRFMNRGVEGVRFAGQGFMWFAAWHENAAGIAVGVLVIVGAWASGLVLAKRGGS